MRDIMVDLETTGTDPVRGAIIQIAAVRFDIQTGDVDGANVFNHCLEVPGWRSWDEGTRAWWSKRHDTLRGIQARARNPHVVINEFADWVGYHSGARLWAKPVTFEFPFLASYFKDFDLPNPFDFRTAVDCRSYLTGLADPDEFIDEKQLEFEGTMHDAIWDVFHQIKWVLHNQEKFRPVAEIV